MRTELALQWDIVEDTIPSIFQELLRSVKDRLLDLKSLIRGGSLKAPLNIDGGTNPDQNKGSFSHWLKELILGFKMLSTNSTKPSRTLRAK